MTIAVAEALLGLEAGVHDDIVHCKVSGAMRAWGESIRMPVKCGRVDQEPPRMRRLNQKHNTIIA